MNRGDYILLTVFLVGAFAIIGVIVSKYPPIECTCEEVDDD